MRGDSELAMTAADAAVYLAIKGIEGVQNAGPITIHTFFGDRIFRNIVVSLVATYGIYILASILALDPWHMRKLLVS
jgi:chitin synthase